MLKNNDYEVILPGQTIGIIGGGQLGRMMAIAARYMGYRIVVLDPTENCPTAQVADEQIVAAYDDMEAIIQLTDKCDVITYEFENVDLEAATYIEQQGKLPQGAYPLAVTQNRQKEKELLQQLGLPVPRFAIVNDGESCRQVLQDFPLPAVVKTCRGGYDGKGQIKIRSEQDIEQAVEFVERHQFCIVEEWILFDQEISIIFSRTASGQFTFFPLAENDHQDHILATTIAPARVSDTVADKAIQAATKIAEKMNIVGTFAIEMFVKGEDIFINEMAPRPHNSGHYTIEACNVSQFTQHIRAICQLPLVEVSLLQPALMINLLGEDLPHAFEKMQEEGIGFIHLYGKAEAQPKRKMGHVTFLAHTIDELQRLQESWLKIDRNNQANGSDDVRGIKHD